MSNKPTANRTALRYVAEMSRGVTPPTPTFKELRYISESLNYSQSNVTSKEIRSDRSVANLIPVKASSAGDVNFELSNESYEDLIQAAMCGTWAVAPFVVEDCQDAWNEAVDSDVTSTADATDFQVGPNSLKLVVAVGASAGDKLATEAITATDLSKCSAIKVWLKSTVVTALGDLQLMLDDTANCASPIETINIPALTANTWTEVTLTLATPLLDTAIISVGIKMAVDIGGFTLRVDSLRGVPTYSTIKNGTLQRSFTIQKHFQDMSVPVFTNFAGQQVGDMMLDFKTGSILTGKFGFMGLVCSSGTTQISGATITAAPTDTPMNAVTDLIQILDNGVASTLAFKSMSLSLNNTLREQEGIGSLFPLDIALGTCNITGNFEAYFSDLVMYNRYINSTAFSMSFMTKDAKGNYYRFTIPAAKIETSKVESGGLDQDIMVSGTYRAIYDPVSNCMIQIDKYVAP